MKVVISLFFVCSILNLVCLGSVEFLTIEEVKFFFHDFYIHQISRELFCSYGTSHIIHDNACWKTYLAFIFTHYFELEFDSFQIYQSGQYFMRLSDYITFFNEFFIIKVVQLHSKYVYLICVIINCEYICKRIRLSVRKYGVAGSINHSSQRI